MTLLANGGWIKASAATLNAATTLTATAATDLILTLGTIVTAADAALTTVGDDVLIDGASTVRGWRAVASSYPGFAADLETLTNS